MRKEVSTSATFMVMTFMDSSHQLCCNNILLSQCIHIFTYFIPLRSVDNCNLNR